MSKKVLDYFLELVQIDSESLCEGAVIAYLQGELERLGLETYIDNAAESTGGESGNLIGWLAGDPDKEPLFLCAHVDTVIPGKGVVPVIDGNLIRSAGNTILGADDKSGIAMILAVIAEYVESGAAHAPLEIVFTVCEEIGLLGAKALDMEKLKSKRGFALDGNKLGEVVRVSPSLAGWKAKLIGKGAHAGIEPEKGINSIRAAAAAVLALPDGRIDDLTTMNTGKINGGRATNIVCEETEIAGEIRSHNEMKFEALSQRVRHIFEQTAKEYDCGLEFELKLNFQSLQIDEDDELVKISEAAFRQAGVEQELAMSGGGSDANVFFGSGLQAIVVGTGMQKIHSTKEYILLDDLQRGGEWLKNVVELWSGK
ncbi:MAG: M20/M25/M40 family metallo-hydrolase [Candidatus Cloacimonetes bacterium]|nr:M20/M25/M40 family metallo-hydrolase [Candidatus Cloacimonadota bacterium]